MPTHIARAPGRINLIGEHIDYSGGIVLPMPINRFATVGASLSHRAGVVRVQSLDLDERCSVEIEAFTQKSADVGSWSSYMLGPIAMIRELHRTLETHGLDLTLRSDIPIGAGLSSSAAVEVATARAAMGLSGIELDPLELAKRCQLAERLYAGVPCGLMDQACVSIAKPGELLAFDCFHEHWCVLRRPSQLAYIVIDSGVRHALGDSAYSARRLAADRAARELGVDQLRAAYDSRGLGSLDSLPEREHDAAEHAFGEMGRVQRAIVSIDENDPVALGRLVNQSHNSLRDTLGVSCDAIDQIVEIAQRTAGVFGARLTGGGFGGCALLLADPDRARAIADTVIEQCSVGVNASLVLIDSGH